MRDGLSLTRAYQPLDFPQPTKRKKGHSPSVDSAHGLTAEDMAQAAAVAEASEMSVSAYLKSLVLSKRQT